MVWRAWMRWAAFALYTAAFFILPCAILGGSAGAALGGLFWLSALFAVAYRGEVFLVRRLGARPLNRAEAPPLFALIDEYCRRLQLPAPQVWLVESPSPNFALFGFARAKGHVVLTSGALEHLPRASLGALVARVLTQHSLGETFLDTWLALFLGSLDRWVNPRRHRRGQSAPRFYSFALFLRQLILYPFCLIPTLCLQRSHGETALDELSLRVSRDPLALSEGLRWLQARYERVPLKVPFSTRHLFLLPPEPADPVGRIFFAPPEPGGRIRQIELGRKPVPLT